jgi:hypothetical protein
LAFGRHSKSKEKKYISISACVFVYIFIVCMCNSIYVSILSYTAVVIILGYTAINTESLKSSRPVLSESVGVGVRYFMIPISS